MQHIGFSFSCLSLDSSVHTAVLQFVETDLSLKMDPKFIELIGGFVPMEMVVNGMTFSPETMLYPFCQISIAIFPNVLV